MVVPMVPSTPKAVDVKYHVPDAELAPHETSRSVMDVITPWSALTVVKSIAGRFTVVEPDCP
jgi:hypothetical protein